jgi:LytS/YehU family sensor histidine kinase
VILTSTFLLLYLRQRQLKKRALEKAEFVHKTAELELQSLRAQLNPHFMFNSLNAIQELILKEDNDNSHLYLSRFSDLLRMLLDNASLPFISIRKELVFLELYLSLENLRIPNLRYSFDVDPNINLDNIMIPNMMLQPYIENAIWHGLSYKKNDRNLKIRVHQDGACTTFEIEDNGIGRKKAAELKSLYRKGHKSKGMELLSKRFGLLSKEYGTTIRAEIFDLANDNDEATGTLVKLNIPFSLMEKEKLVVYDQNYNN